jgi:two-component system, OmpR family, response regulator RegX3
MPDKVAPVVPVARIAILDDDPDQLLALSKWLGEAGYETSTFDRGAALLKFLKTPLADGTPNADAALVDWGLPDMSGVDVIQKMRDELKLDIPIILITSRNAEQDIVEGLEAGADDYLVKPARHMECIARVEAALRRANSIRAEKALKDKPVFFGAYHFDVGAREVLFDTKKVLLTEKELQLVLLLFNDMGNVVSRNIIWSTVWGIVSNQVSSRTIDTHIYRLRTKLELEGQHGYVLKTLHGKGYRLSVPNVPNVEADGSQP